MHQPNLNSLRLFDAAARHLNFRLAAEERQLTQGAVAQQVRRLEDDLNLKLFKRLARGLSLTDAGARYHKAISPLLNQIDEITTELKTQDNTLVISVTPSFASKWLVPRLTDFNQKHPDIEINLMACEEHAPFKSGNNDLAIRLTPSPYNAEKTEDHYSYERLSPLKFRAVCSPNYTKKIASINTNALKNFLDYTLIQDGLRHWERLFEKAEIKLNQRIAVYNQTSLAIEAAINDQGIALTPSILTDEDIKKGKLINLWEDENATIQSFWIGSKKSLLEKPAKRDFIQWLHQSTMSPHEVPEQLVESG